MKFLHTISTIFWLLLLVIACNTTPDNNSNEKEQTHNTDPKTEDTKANDKDAINTDISSETFPDGGGYKGRYNDYVFYLEISDAGVKGFVRHKKDNTENEVSGKMSSPFDFNAEELLEDEDGETSTLAKLHGKKGDDDNSFELDYNDSHSATTFKITLER